MSSTIIIDANRSISKYKDDNKLKWINTLDGGIQLKKGDRVSINATQINQRGANIETLNFGTDINEEMVFCYYIMDTDISFMGTDALIETMYRDGSTRPSGMEVSKVGYTNTPYIYFGSDHTDLRPFQGSQTITIPAGSYSPDNIAVIMSEIMSGKSENLPYDYIRSDGLRTNINDFGIAATNTEFMISINPNNISPSVVSSGCPMFLQQKQSKEFIDDIINDGGAVTKSEMIGKGKHWLTTQAYDDTSIVSPNPINEFQFLGAIPTLTWDAEHSRFNLNSLNTPYRIPNYKTATDDKPEEDRGQTATEIYRNAIPYLKYPKSSFGGVLITNPAFGYVSRNTQIGKDIVDKLTNGSDAEKRQAEVKKTTYKFTDYFNSTKEALEGWKNTFWYRLGFSMEQFTDDSKWLKFFNMEDIEETNGVYDLKAGVTEATKMLGITTTAELTTNLSVMSGGLGNLHHGTDKHGFVNQGYSYEAVGRILNSKENPGGVVVKPEYYLMLTDTMPLTARNLPKLDDQPYYNIKSDIVDNSNWFSNQGNRTTLMGQCTKNYSAGDYIFSYSADIQFTITKDRVINEITTEILNPDETSPNPELFDEHCAVLYKIERVLEVQPVKK